jgi:hypothetical protein
MGGGFGPKGEMLLCDGQAIVDKLNNVFGDPTTQQYMDAKNNNAFGEIENRQGNYLALIGAYVSAGVDVDRGWAFYLKQLGKGTDGAKDIHDIAKTRDHALKHNVPMMTSLHNVSDTPHGGRHVKRHEGSSGADRSTVDSPFPLSP